MVNTSNMVIVTGKMVSDIKTFDNKDGSKKVRFNVAAANNYKNTSDGKRESQFIPFEAFIPAGKGLGVFDIIHQGDLVSIAATIKNNNYEANGEKVYGLILAVESVTPMEAKAVTDARQARRIAAEAATEEVEAQA